MDIVVNSCLAFYKKTLPPLLESLKRAGVQPQNIHVVVGDSEDFHTEQYNDDGIILNFVPYKNIDENGFFWAAMHTDKRFSPYIFYMHDTTHVHVNFLESCIEWSKKLEIGGYDCAKLRMFQSMCMGFYHSRLFHDPLVAEYLFKNQNMTEANKQMHKRTCEDRLFKYLNGHGYKLFVLPNANIDDSVIDRGVDRFDTGNRRHVEFFEIPGVYKYKTGVYGFSL